MSKPDTSLAFSPTSLYNVGAIGTISNVLSAGRTSVHIITRKRLNEFAARHPNAKPALQQWYVRMKSARFVTFAELRAVFPHADQVGKLTVFNIGGNNVRLIAAIHYNRQKVYIRAVLTHAEYDQGSWKE